MSIPVTTSDIIEGHPVKQYLGVVRGIVVRSPTIAQGFMGGLKSIVGGKIGAYTQMCEHAREEAHQLMLTHAQELGANAVIAMRYDTGELGQIGTEVLCYGTAVII
ncbi:YbjQ family protein [Legionella nagasakiensis]|uniref:YbjQ family protein n=1 Tax=Legionella nagasakiensis TaxID=535290 RepID=UPI0010568AC6|nr:YbjQ family protein [Legionella nagasakiensis]